MLRFLRPLVLTALALASLAPPASAQSKGPLVLAAASLQESMTAAADAWARRGHARPVISFAASSALARQVAAGAPADLFVSADEDWMDDLAKRGLLAPGTRADLLGNRLVLVTARTDKTRVELKRGVRLDVLLGTERLAMTDPASAPAGISGKAALNKLGA